VLRPILSYPSIYTYIYQMISVILSLQIRTWYVFQLFPTCATCPTHLILLDLIFVIFYREYKPRSFSLRSFPSSPTVFLPLLHYKHPFLDTVYIFLVCLFVFLNLFRDFFFLLFLD